MSATAIRVILKKHDISLDGLIAIKDIDKLNKYLKKEVRIAVIGGDGTISAVASKVTGTAAILVPLPGGTLNHFTKDLGVSQNLDQALETLASANVRRIDVARLNNRVFINNSSLGMYPTSLRVRDRYERYIGKWPAAVIAAARTWVGMRSYTVTIDDETFKTPFVFVGNNRYQLDTVGTAVRDDLDDDCLSVFIAKTTSRWKLLKIALWALIGKSKELDEFEVRAASSLTIRARKRHLHVSYDGEVIRMKSPLHYKIEPKALRVLC